eukprot:jgi/Botrbrau1/2517/Bobra.0079s0009.1
MWCKVERGCVLGVCKGVEVPRVGVISSPAYPAFCLPRVLAPRTFSECPWPILNHKGDLSIGTRDLS